jgi:hypothetical protein
MQSDHIAPIVTEKKYKYDDRRQNRWVVMRSLYDNRGAECVFQ